MGILALETTLKSDLNVGNSIDAVFVRINEDGGNGKSEEDESTKESDLPDRNEPENKTINAMISLKSSFKLFGDKIYFTGKFQTLQ